MGRYKWLTLLALLFTLGSCKKQTELVDPVIKVENVFVEYVRSDQVDINYGLSHLGYQETGVSYYKKSNPTATVFVKAIRVNDRLMLSLQALEANTEYVFKVFYKHNNEQITDTNEYTVKTLSAELAKYSLNIKTSTMSYEDNGSFTLDIEGDNLNNLNLSELAITVNLNPLTFSYPTLIAGNRYKITINGKVNPINENNLFRGVYQGEDILLQSVRFAFGGERHWLTYQATSLRGYRTTVFNNELYYFYSNQVYKWNDAEHRMVTVGAIPERTIPTNVAGFAFEGQLFFQPVEKSNWSPENNLADSYRYPEAYSYTPATGKWTVFTFNEKRYESNRAIRNSNYFVHKGELYLVYGLADGTGGNPNLERENFIYRYNKSTGQFEIAANLGAEFLSYHFSSVNNQLYLTGLVPVYDQGFKLSVTFAAFTVTDDFDLKEVYRAGTVAHPLAITPRYASVYDQKILILDASNLFFLFDPADQRLYQVHLKNTFSNTYLGEFFIYNDKLHLNTNIGFTSYTIYEISIAKGL